MRREAADWPGRQDVERLTRRREVGRVGRRGRGLKAEDEHDDHAEAQPSTCERIGTSPLQSRCSRTARLYRTRDSLSRLAGQLAPDRLRADRGASSGGSRHERVGSGVRARGARAPRCGRRSAASAPPGRRWPPRRSTCAGAADASLQPHRVITGEFDTSLERAYVMLPFDVPAGTTAVRVRYCHDQPEAPTNARIKHVLDLGLWRRAPGAGRAVGGAGVPRLGRLEPPRRDGLAQRLLERGAVPREPAGSTARDARRAASGPARSRPASGRSSWASRRSPRRREGDSDGRVAWRVEIDLSTDPLWEADPYAPAPYDDDSGPAGRRLVRGRLPRPRRALLARRRDDDARPSTTRSGRSPQGGAGLDFITLSDYVTDTAWGEIGRHQPAHPGKLIVALQRDHHLPRPREQPRQPALRRPPHRPGLRARRRTATLDAAARAAAARARSSTPSTPAAASPRSTTRDLPLGGARASTSSAAAAPGTTRAADTDYSQVDAIEIATGPGGPEGGPAARARTRSRRSRSSSGRTRSTPAAATATRSPRSARATRTTPAARPTP